MSAIEIFMFGGISLIIILFGFTFAFSRFYRKVGPEEAVVRSGKGGLKAATGSGIWVIPILHRAEIMDLSLKRIEISRRGEAGLICQDNIRADIEVAFFVRVNNQTQDIKTVAEILGCRRASDQRSLVELFDAKFSEALKTVGKRFDFVELYNERDKFKEAILQTIGTDLNGYVLDDCAIDYLEQTDLELLNPNNILDAEGIKKITDLTAREHVLANDIKREKEKVIKKQDVEAAEVIYELEKQRVEAEQKQKREIATVTAREEAEAARVQEEERLKAERARIVTEEEIQVAEENKDRQIIVALKNKQRTDAVETERVEKDRMLEVTERNRVVGLADIEKEKMIETEKRNIQEVIRERVMVERAVVEEQQRIIDTEEFAGADRQKQVAVTLAEKEAQEALVKEVKAADAKKQAAELNAEQVVIEAEAERSAAEKETAAKKMLAEALTAEEAALGLAEAQVTEAKAVALEKEGTAEATVLQRMAVAEAKGQEAKAVAVEKEGTAEANVMQLKFGAEAQGIEDKANAMKLFDGVGREHEEFKLRLNKDKDIEIAAIQAQQEIAEAQSEIVGQALKTARIDIVGGETTFFDKIVDSIKAGKAIDRFIHNSETMTDVKNTFFNGNPEYFKEKLQSFVDQFGMNFEDVKDLSVSALIGKLLLQANDDESRSDLNRILSFVRGSGMADKTVKAIGIGELEKSKKS
ncbi:MAG: flotillin family protein [Planctomycetes bacterium]|nr:flotillin family protein [Planctomycetota bacterium]